MSDFITREELQKALERIINKRGLHLGSKNDHIMYCINNVIIALLYEIQTELLKTREEKENG